MSCESWTEPVRWTKYFRCAQKALDKLVDRLGYTDGPKLVSQPALTKAPTFSASFREFLAGTQWLHGRVSSLNSWFQIRNMRVDPYNRFGERAWENGINWVLPFEINCRQLVPQPACSLFECGLLLQPFYGYVDSNNVRMQIRSENKSPQAELYGVFWLTYFNSQYVRFFVGEKTFEQLKDVDVKFYDDGGVVLKLGETPGSVPIGLRQAIQDRLGKNTFWNAKHQSRKNLGQYALTYEQICPSESKDAERAEAGHPENAEPPAAENSRAMIRKRPRKDAESLPMSVQYEISGIPLVLVSGDKAIANWRRLRKQSAKRSWLPVILGPREDCERVFSTDRERLKPEQILARAEKLDPKKWFSKWAKSHPGNLDDLELSDSEVDMEIDKIEPPSWPAKQRVFIGLFPIEASWQVFAHLDYAGWNECPPAANHCAVQHYWHKRFGTEVMSLAYDRIYLEVAQRPRSKQATLDLAREQYVYCPDTVEQGTQSIGALAGMLSKSKHWYFWWD
jgi:hypothetical protein